MKDIFKDARIRTIIALGMMAWGQPDFEAIMKALKRKSKTRSKARFIELEPLFNI